MPDTPRKLPFTPRERVVTPRDRAVAAADTEPMRPSDLKGRFTISETVPIPEVAEPDIPDSQHGTAQIALPSGMHERGKLGRFDILDVLGQGGMGVVIAAYDPQLDRKVAIKVLRTKGLHGKKREKEAARLLREARAMAQLSHPHVVTVYEAGEIDDRVYIAMEYIAGQTLRGWQDECERSVAETLDAYVKAGRGLAAGHQAGLIHRDFKPDNVLVGHDGRVRVIDFGLARPARALDSSRDSGELTDEPIEMTSSDLHARLTTVGSLFGTPIYMAPEQHQKLELDARADQFAFCASLYEALYGQLPFAADSYVQLADAVIEGKVRIPPDKPDIPKRVVDAIMRGLLPDPNDRFASMIELLDQLEPPVKKRRLWLWIAGAAVVAASLTVAAFLLLASPPATQQVADLCTADQRPDAVWDKATSADVKQALRASGRSHAQDTWERVDGSLYSFVAEWKQRRTQVCESTSVQVMLQQRLRCLDHGLEQARVLVSVLRKPDPTTADSAVMAVHQLPSPSECATLKGEALEAPTAQDKSYWTDMVNLRATVGAGRYGAAVGQAKQLLMVAKAMGNVRYEADVGMWLAQSYMGNSGKAADADQAIRDALDAAARAKDDLLTAQLLILQIFIRGVQLGDIDGALALQPIANNAIRRAEGDDKLRAQLEHAVGTVQLQRGDLKNAIASFESAVQLEIKSKGEDSQSIPQMLNNLGAAYIKIGNVFEAKATLEKALKLQRKILGPSHPDTAVVMSSLGGLAQAFGNWDEATQYHKAALAILEEVRGSNHEQIGQLYYGLAISANGKEDYQAALPLYQKALGVFEKLPQPHPYVALSLVGTADCLEEIGQPKEAVVDGERALALMGIEKPDASLTDQVQLAMARFILAKALWAAGIDKPRARQLATKAHAGFKAGGLIALTGLAAVEKWFAKIDGKKL